METWKSVTDYEDLYEVSNLGNVRSVDHFANTSIRNVKARLIKGRILKKTIKTNGYYSVDLSKNGVTNSVSVHRLVAVAFVENVSQCKVVNHINGIKTDNRPENLEWVTYKENHWHARDHKLLNDIGQYQNKRIICVETEIIFENSVRAAEWLISTNSNHIKVNNVKTIAKNIRSSITGRTPKAYGYRWKEI